MDFAFTSVVSGSNMTVNISVSPGGHVLTLRRLHLFGQHFINDLMRNTVISKHKSGSCQIQAVSQWVSLLLLGDINIGDEA